jgi:hypothetical protein
MTSLLVFLLICVLFVQFSYAQKKLALVVGIAGYPNFPQGERLQYAGRDAEDFTASIETPQGGSFHPGNVHLVINDVANRERLYEEFDWLYRSAGPHDTVYIFLQVMYLFSGIPHISCPTTHQRIVPRRLEYLWGNSFAR